MISLEKSKERLRDALVKLESVISSRLARQELENQMLREEISKLKQNNPKFAALGKHKAVKNEEFMLNNKEYLKADNEITLSIKELKKLVE